jgi:hypothetical protein
MCDIKIPILVSDIKHRKKYIDDTHVKENIHAGQTKLLYSEIEFISRYAKDMPKKDRIFLYVGAAVGCHLIILRELFPDFTYVLYDKTPFDPRLKELPNVDVRSQYFTDADVAEFTGRNVLFVSDIRRPLTESYTENDRSIKEDMEMQQSWVEGIKPFAAMLKFRLPFTPGTSKYLDGPVHLQVMARDISPECRLIIKGTSYKYRDYDHTEHEEKLFYYNTEIRAKKLYKHKIKELCNKYECIRMYKIICDYFGYLGKKENEKAILAILRDIKRRLNPNSNYAIGST